MQTSYDAVIVGAGHNGLVAACYLALAGKSVLVLEQNEVLGGATLSKQAFKGLDARLSVYSYLVSLLPQQILTDLGIRFETHRRAIASYTPLASGRGLLISNESEAVTRQSFMALTGDEREYNRYQELQALVMCFAEKAWPTLLERLPARQALQSQFKSAEERRAWEFLVERPLGELIETYLQDDTVRGAVFTDAKIGVSTWAHDPSLLQNRCFLIHNIGQGNGEWRVPAGGMGRLVDALVARGRELGVTYCTQARVVQVEAGMPANTVIYQHAGRELAVDGRWVLFNCSADGANRCLPDTWDEPQLDGSVYKINMLLKRLPALREANITVREAFSGTLHMHEGYQHMQESYDAARQGQRLAALPGEMYCHSLTDPSILSPDLQAQGYQTLTLFGLDVPYDWFGGEHERVKAELTHTYLRGIEDLVAADFAGCLALDADGQPCIEARSPLDLERSLGLPRGNIFHGSLDWPFSDDETQAGTWGVATRYPRIVMCGSSARRGGAVSGLPGYYAARHIFDSEGGGRA